MNDTEKLVKNNVTFIQFKTIGDLFKKEFDVTLSYDKLIPLVNDLCDNPYFQLLLNNINFTEKKNIIENINKILNWFETEVLNWLKLAKNIKNMETDKSFYSNKDIIFDVNDLTHLMIAYISKILINSKYGDNTCWKLSSVISTKKMSLLPMRYDCCIICKFDSICYNNNKQDQNELENESENESYIDLASDQTTASKLTIETEILRLLQLKKVYQDPTYKESMKDKCVKVDELLLDNMTSYIRKNGKNIKVVNHYPR